jgi:hypothetical protein
LIVRGKTKRSFLSMVLKTRTGLPFAVLKSEYGIEIK